MTARILQFTGVTRMAISPHAAPAPQSGIDASTRWEITRHAGRQHPDMAALQRMSGRIAQLIEAGLYALAIQEIVALDNYQPQTANLAVARAVRASAKLMAEDRVREIEAAFEMMDNLARDDVDPA